MEFTFDAGVGVSADVTMTGGGWGGHRPKGAVGVIAAKPTVME